MKKDYRLQATNNILAFYDAEYTPRRELLHRIVEKFDNSGLQWCVGCSFSLFLRGIVDDFHDFDILVANKDIEKAKNIMREITKAEPIATGGNGFCNSDDYSHWQFNNCDIDLIAGFRVETFGSSLYVPVRPNIFEIMDIEFLPCKIPVINVEPLYLLYAMMEGWQPKRKYKRELIEEYFSKVKPSKELLEYYLNFNPKEPDSSVAPWIVRRVVDLFLT